MFWCLYFLLFFFDQLCEGITFAVNSAGGAARSLDEVKKKWRDLRLQYIAYIDSTKKTGGGAGDVKPPVFMDLIESIIGQNSVVCIGIRVTGTDSCEPPGASVPVVESVVNDYSVGPYNVVVTGIDRRFCL